MERLPVDRGRCIEGAAGRVDALQCGDLGRGAPCDSGIRPGNDDEIFIELFISQLRGKPLIEYARASTKHSCPTR